MIISIYQIDAFTKEQFKGNPAAVCPLKKWISDDLMEKIAEENNLSETAFFVRKNDEYELRWFTPKGEIDLCGHATLATAYVIFTYMNKDANKISFNTKSGVLEVYREKNLLTMIFPTRRGERCTAPNLLIKALGKKPLEVYKSRDYMVVFEKEEDILNLNPNMEELKKLDTSVIVTAKGKNVDFVSRFFAPNVGVNEDPVTGSSHCTLVPYWKDVLEKSELVSQQVSKRSGMLYCIDLGEKVKISGEAVTYSEGYVNV